MREHRPGYGVTIYECEGAGDLPALSHWLAKQSAVAIDTETTGLNWAAKDFDVRLVQFGNATESWVVPADLLRGGCWLTTDLPAKLYMHNAPFDLLVMHATGLADVGHLSWRVSDTRILAHLLDPRSRVEGGLGHGLKELSTQLIDPDAGRLEKELSEVFKTELKAKPVSAGWRLIPNNHPTYVQYAGLDPIWTYRLAEILERRVRLAGMSHLIDFEHQVQRLTTDMMRRGIPLDVDYTKGLSAELEDRKLTAEVKASLLGCENVNSPDQVVAALMALGWVPDPKKVTGTGKPAVDKDVLNELAALGSPLAKAVVEAKRAGKWQTSYVEAMLSNRDSADRIHPTIRSLAARTARMSVSDPPLQQLPTGDATIRRCLIAEPGSVIGGVDYKAIEMRVLASLAGVRRMQDAILAGEDMHDFTATALYGEGFLPEQRKLAKNAGFLKVYGGGAKKMVTTAGVPMPVARKTMKMYDDLYPEIDRFSKQMAAEAVSTGAITTCSGRRLPVDHGREYAAVNYMVQSTARDVLAQGLIDIDRAGLLEYVLLPVHDEVLFSAPSAIAESIATEISKVLRVSDFRGLPLDVDASVYGMSWGHGYGAES